MRTHHCTECDIEFTNPTCPRCGGPPERLASAPSPEVVSDPSDTMDTMIERASRPSLASLVKAGLRRGLIQPLHDYAQQRKA